MEGRKEEEKVRLEHLVLSARQATRLVQTLRHMARTEDHLEDARKWRDIACRLVSKGGGPYRYKRQVKRPKDDDPVAVQRLLEGVRPFPVLSHADARRVFVALNKRGMSARQIGDCLYVDKHTVTRWRRELKEGRWKGKYE